MLLHCVSRWNVYILQKNDTRTFQYQISQHYFYWNPVSVAFLTPKVGSDTFWASVVEYWWSDAIYLSSGLLRTSFVLASKSSRRFTVLPSFHPISLARLHPRCGTFNSFLGAGADELRKAAVGFLSVRPSVRPHWTALLSLEGFSWNFVSSTSLQKSVDTFRCWLELEKD